MAAKGVMRPGSGPCTMKHLTELMVSRLRTSQSAEEVCELLTRVTHELGFEHWAYGLKLPLPFTRPRFLMVSNYEARWVERYQAQGYFAIDPTVLHGTRTMTPQVWQDRAFASTPQLWDEAKSFGLRFGWAQSCFDGAGRIGMLSIVRSHQKLSPREILSQDPRWRSLANVAHIELSSRLLRSDLVGEVQLTARQIEVLSWTADGKTAEQVALILGVSLHTIHYHLKNAITRLGAGNKLAAVAMAIRLGLLN